MKLHIGQYNSRFNVEGEEGEEGEEGVAGESRGSEVKLHWFHGVLYIKVLTSSFNMHAGCYLLHRCSLYLLLS